MNLLLHLCACMLFRSCGVTFTCHQTYPVLDHMIPQHHRGCLPFISSDSHPFISSLIMIFAVYAMNSVFIAPLTPSSPKWSTTFIWGWIMSERQELLTHENSLTTYYTCSQALFWSRMHQGQKYLCPNLLRNHKLTSKIFNLKNSFRFICT